MLYCTPVLYLTDRNLGQPYTYKPLGKPTLSSLWFYFKREKKVFSDYKSQVAILLSAQRAETTLQSSVTKGRNITKYVHIAHVDSRSHQNKAASASTGGLPSSPSQEQPAPNVSSTSNDQLSFTSHIQMVSARHPLAQTYPRDNNSSSIPWTGVRHH